MPRFPRSYIKTSFFHVITQGINKQYIFDQSEDIKYYIKIMYELLKEHNIEIIAYCIMNNHAHILIKTEIVKELSKYMQRLNTRYGKYYNKKYNRVGYVFRDRYKSEGIYSEEHLYNCIQYIYNNPVKAGICLKAEEYPYSNYKKIIGNTTDSYSFIDIEKDTEKICKDVLAEFLQNNNINLLQLKNDKIKLKKLVILLKEKYNVSFRKISKEININREKLRRIYND